MANAMPHIKSKDYWSIEALPGLNIDWDLWFRINFNSKLLPRKCKDFNIKLFHGWLSTESRLSRMGYSDGICKCCKADRENAEHLLMRCQYRQHIWKLLQTSLRKSIDNSFRLSRTEILAGYFLDDNSPKNQIINMCIGITRYHLWLTRNTIINDKGNVTFIQCHQILKYRLTDHMNILIISEKTQNDIKELLHKVVDDIKSTFLME